MKYVKLKQRKEIPLTFKPVETNDENLHVLAAFLESEVNNEGRYHLFIDWLNGIYKHHTIFGNYIGLTRKPDDKKVYVCFEDDNEEVMYTNFVAQDGKQMFNILTDWAKLFTEYPEYPTEILITQDNNGNVLITGKYK